MVWSEDNKCLVVDLDGNMVDITHRLLSANWNGTTADQGKKLIELARADTETCAAAAALGFRDAAWDAENEV